MRCTGFVLVGLYVAVALAFGMLGAPPASGSTGGLDRFPAPELSIDGLLPPTDARDELPITLSNDFGQVCVLAIENLRLRRILSGAGYPVPDEATVYDGGEVVEFLATQSERTQVSVALLTGSATGGLDVVVLSSSDLCQTWGSPVTVVGSGSSVHPAGTLIAFDQNRIGVLALLFLDTLEFKPYLVSSIDDGVSWRSPLALDSAPSVAPPLVLPRDWTAPFRAPGHHPEFR